MRFRPPTETFPRKKTRFRSPTETFPRKKQGFGHPPRPSLEEKRRFVIVTKPSLEERRRVVGVIGRGELTICQYPFSPTRPNWFQRDSGPLARGVPQSLRESHSRRHRYRLENTHAPRNCACLLCCANRLLSLSGSLINQLFILFSTLAGKG